MKKNIRLKKIITMAVTVLIAVAVFAVGVFAEEKEELSASAHFSLPNGFEYTTDIIAADRMLFNEQGVYIGQVVTEYSFVFPYNAKDREITLEFDNIDLMAKDGAEYTDGGSYVLEEGVYTVHSQGDEYTVTVQYTSDIYQVYLTLDDSIKYVEEEKGNESRGTIVITDGISTEYSGGLDSIKGRGNSSWAVKKKPYNLRLSAKTSLFGMGASKKYAVTPLFHDVSMVKEVVAVQLGKDSGIEYCMDGRHVDLYINGDYRGLYYFTERVEVDRSRINIFDLEELNEQLNPDIDIETLPESGDTGKGSCKIKGGYKWVDIPLNITDTLGGGYLLEYDLGERYDQEKSGFVSENGQAVVLKSPEYASKGQVEYMREYYQQFEDALISDDGYNSLGKHYSDYIDVESFARMYVFQEYAFNADAGMSSAFMYKDVGGKLTMCTVWDLDYGFGINQKKNGVDFTDPEAIWATVGKQENKAEKTIFTLLCAHPEFRHMAAEIWSEDFAPNIPSLVEKAEETQNTIYDSARATRLRWWFEGNTIEDFEKDNIWVREFLALRGDFMSRFMNTDANYVVYRRNGAEGTMIDKYSYMSGTQAELLACEFTCGEAQFLGWNTKADGSGTAYQPGDEITVDEDIILYAQWARENANIQNDTQTTENMGLFMTIINWFENLFK